MFFIVILIMAIQFNLTEIKQNTDLHMYDLIPCLQSEHAQYSYKRVEIHWEFRYRHWYDFIEHVVHLYYMVVDLGHFHHKICSMYLL